MLHHPNGSEMSRAPGPRDGRPAQRGVKGKPMRNLNDAWEIIWECARLEDMRRHGLPAALMLPERRRSARASR